MEAGSGGAIVIAKQKLESAYRYGNLLRCKPKRDYVFAYIAWLNNGAMGIEPERGRLSYMAAQAVRMTIDGMKLWEVAA